MFVDNFQSPVVAWHYTSYARVREQAFSFLLTIGAKAIVLTERLEREEKRQNDHKLSSIESPNVTRYLSITASPTMDDFKNKSSSIPPEIIAGSDDYIIMRGDDTRTDSINRSARQNLALQGMKEEAEARQILVRQEQLRTMRRNIVEGSTISVTKRARNGAIRDIQIILYQNKKAPYSAVIAWRSKHMQQIKCFEIDYRTRITLNKSQEEIKRALKPNEFKVTQPSSSLGNYCSLLAGNDGVDASIPSSPQASETQPQTNESQSRRYYPNSQFIYYNYSLSHDSCFFEVDFRRVDREKVHIQEFILCETPLIKLALVNQSKSKSQDSEDKQHIGARNYEAMLQRVSSTNSIGSRTKSMRKSPYDSFYSPSSYQNRLESDFPPSPIESNYQELINAQTNANSPPIKSRQHVNNEKELIKTVSRDKGEDRAAGAVYGWSQASKSKRQSKLELTSISQTLESKNVNASHKPQTQYREVKFPAFPFTRLQNEMRHLDIMFHRQVELEAFFHVLYSFVPGIATITL